MSWRNSAYVDAAVVQHLQDAHSSVERVSVGERLGAYSLETDKPPVQARHRACTQLVGEMEIQGRAIDAARSNVEKHYGYMHDAYVKFMQR